MAQHAKLIGITGAIFDEGVPTQGTTQKEEDDEDMTELERKANDETKTTQSSNRWQ